MVTPLKLGVGGSSNERRPMTEDNRTGTSPAQPFMRHAMNNRNAGSLVLDFPPLPHLIYGAFPLKGPCHHERQALKRGIMIGSM